MLKLLKKILFLIFGSCLVIGGLFTAVAGVLGGLGATSLGLKIAYLLAGLLALLFGLYLYYQGSNRNILKVIGDIIDAILTNI